MAPACSSTRKDKPSNYPARTLPPAPLPAAKFLSPRFAHPPQRNRLLFGIPLECLSGREVVEFPAKASDAVEPAHEIRFIRCLDALHLFRRWPVLQEFLELFLHILVNGSQA